jgi:hypothetical protein
MLAAAGGCSGATTDSMLMDPADPNSGGNQRKSMIRSVERSLKRLETDYLDLLYLHAWDGTTSGDEVMRALDDLARTGQILYAGISNTPTWQIAHMQTCVLTGKYTAKDLELGSGGAAASRDRKRRRCQRRTDRTQPSDCRRGETGGARAATAPAAPTLVRSSRCSAVRCRTRPYRSRPAP